VSEQGFTGTVAARQCAFSLRRYDFTALRPAAFRLPIVFSLKSPEITWIEFFMKN